MAHLFLFYRAVSLAWGQKAYYRWAMKEPTPICLLQTKVWQWFTNNVVNDQEAFQNSCDDPDYQGTWWKPTGLMSKMKAPFLLAIPNALVELLRDQGTPATPADDLNTINEVTANTGGGIAENKWRTVQDWCILAGQGSASSKSLLAIKVDSVAIDIDKFNTWVGQKLDAALGLRPTQATQAATTPQPPMADYSQLSCLQAATVGLGMMQFTNALVPQAAPGAATLGQTASLKIRKGFNRDQIVKLKDACGVNMAKDIPHIWYMIQTMKGKAYNTYHNHLKKSIESWCCTWHIEREKSIYF
jgi:hypothetical protein